MMEIVQNETETTRGVVLCHSGSYYIARTNKAESSPSSTR